jgi:hypothetical protein
MHARNDEVITFTSQQYPKHALVEASNHGSSSLYNEK